MKIILFLILFFSIFSLIIINNNDLILSDKEDFQKFSYLLSNNFHDLYLNLQDFTGYVVNKLEALE